ncbi:hypothetical protein [Thalassospira lucentensis]|uniref:hypothetical protein n=1 Tax=Thalassospira lucentensis TaxID=168935 RepID=UPI003AA93E48
MKVMMILAIGAVFALCAGPMPVHAASDLTSADQLAGQVIEHGGGCRKSSPPGQCCHMDNKAGSVHCH